MRINTSCPQLRLYLRVPEVLPEEGNSLSGLPKYFAVSIRHISEAMGSDCLSRAARHVGLPSGPAQDEPAPASAAVAAGAAAESLPSADSQDLILLSDDEDMSNAQASRPADAARPHPLVRMEAGNSGALQAGRGPMEDTLVRTCKQNPATISGLG